MASEYAPKSQAELRLFVIAERLSYLGKNRDSKLQEFDETFGNGNWAVLWAVGANAVWLADTKQLSGRYVLFDYARACKLYEDAYYEHFKQHPDELEFIINRASEVFDNAETNTNSRLDYLIQEESSTHIQDIAIRNVIARFGRRFNGAELLQIRTDGVGEKWNPANIEFHRQAWFVEPRNVRDADGKERWWARDRYQAKEKSVECWWQSNKFLCIKK